MAGKKRQRDLVDYVHAASHATSAAARASDAATRSREQASREAHRAWQRRQAAAARQAREQDSVWRGAFARALAGLRVPCPACMEGVLWTAKRCRSCKTDRPATAAARAQVHESLEASAILLEVRPDLAATALRQAPAMVKAYVAARGRFLESNLARFEGPARAVQAEEEQEAADLEHQHRELEALSVALSGPLVDRYWGLARRVGVTGFLGTELAVAHILGGVSSLIDVVMTLLVGAVPGLVIGVTAVWAWTELLGRPGASRAALSEAEFDHVANTLAGCTHQGTRVQESAELAAQAQQLGTDMDRLGVVERHRLAASAELATCRGKPRTTAALESACADCVGAFRGALPTAPRTLGAQSAEAAPQAVQEPDAGQLETLQRCRQLARHVLDAVLAQPGAAAAGHASDEDVDELEIDDGAAWLQVGAHQYVSLWFTGPPARPLHAVIGFYSDHESRDPEYRAARRHLLAEPDDQGDSRWALQAATWTKLGLEATLPLSKDRLNDPGLAEELTRVLTSLWRRADRAL